MEDKFIIAAVDDTDDVTKETSTGAIARHIADEYFFAFYLSAPVCENCE
jgi:hypothetical protein